MFILANLKVNDVGKVSFSAKNQKDTLDDGIQLFDGRIGGLGQQHDDTFNPFQCALSSNKKCSISLKRSSSNDKKLGYKRVKKGHRKGR